MLQAIIDSTNTVISVNNWDPGVGIPCDEFTQPGMYWDGQNFVKHPNEVKKELVDSVQAYLDDTVRTRNYDNIISCCSYANSQVPKFASEAQAAINWRDAVWTYCYGVMAEVESGNRQIPTSEELISELPTINW